MKHYCRYCSHCVGVDESLGWCEEHNVEVSKTSIRNACTGFDFCEINAFYYNRSNNSEDAKYKPRVAKKKQCDGQLSLFGC